MSIDEAIGYYTYRSFLNRPGGAPNDILWGEGELFLLISDEGDVLRRQKSVECANPLDPIELQPRLGPHCIKESV